MAQQNQQQSGVEKAFLATVVAGNFLFMRLFVVVDILMYKKVVGARSIP